jgi:type IV secretion system protein VirB6
MGLFADIETTVISQFGVVATTFGSGLLGVFRPAFITGFTIWITLIAYEVAFGKSEDGFTYIFTKIGKIFFIGVLALYGWPELAELLNGVKDGFVGSGTISSILDTKLVNPYYDLYIVLFQWANEALTASATGFAILNVVKILMIIVFLVLLVFVFACFGAVLGVICAILMATYLLANSIFVLLLAVGPFFLLCLAFPFTQRFFETYIGNVVTAILGMAFTVLMVNFVASLVGFDTPSALFPPASDPESVISNIKSVLIYFGSQIVKLGLIVYLYFKIFDLAASLGGGLNMGSNAIAGVRSVMRDKARGGTGKSSQKPSNQMSQASPGGAVKAAASKAASTAGTLLSGGASNLASIASYSAGRAVGSASSAGRFAYNRYSQNRNRISSAS